jgi:predicted acetyltransferase
VELARFSNRRSHQLACTLARNADRWSQLCADPNLRVTLHGASGVEGYAITADSRDSYGGKMLRVLDLAAITPQAWRALVGSLTESAAESVEWLASPADLAASGVMRSPAPLREGFKPRSIATVRPQFQCRVVDLPGALRARAATLPQGEYHLAIQLRDDLLPENETPVALRCAGGTVEVDAARPTDPVLELDVRIFSQLYTGFMSPSEAVSQGLAHCDSSEALEIADALFPAGEPFIAEIDRF